MQDIPNALAFSREWQPAESEDADAKSFWDDFFAVFGVKRRRVATFETRVKKLEGKDGYIDLLWKGKLLIEHKSRGKDLDRAHAQAAMNFSTAQKGIASGLSMRARATSRWKQSTNASRWSESFAKAEAGRQPESWRKRHPYSARYANPRVIICSSPRFLPKQGRIFRSVF